MVEENNQVSEEQIFQERLNRFVFQYTWNLKNGDFVISLLNDKGALQNEMIQRVSEFFRKDLEDGSITSQEVSDITAQIIVSMPKIVAEMKQKMLGRLEESFAVQYYENFPEVNLAELSEHSRNMVTKEDKAGIVDKVMTDILSGAEPYFTVNLYNFSKANLEFLRPKVESMVDQLFIDYKSQNPEKV